MDRLQPGRLADQLAGLAARPLEQHLGAAADARLVEGELLGVEQGLEALEALVHHFGGNLILHLGRRRSGPGRIFERESLGIVHRRDDPQRRLELGLGLAGEADDEVAGDGDVGARGADPVEDAQIGIGVVAAVHRLQHAVAARLHRQMQIGHQLFDLGMGADQALGHVVGMAGRVADAGEARQRVERADQGVEARAPPRPARHSRSGRAG